MAQFCIAILVALWAAIVVGAVRYWLLGGVLHIKKPLKILCPYHALSLGLGQIALLDQSRCEMCFVEDESPSLPVLPPPTDNGPGAA